MKTTLRIRVDVETGLRTSSTSFGLVCLRVPLLGGLVFWILQQKLSPSSRKHGSRFFLVKLRVMLVQVFGLILEGWLPTSDEITLPYLTDDMLFHVVHAESPFAVAFDGWGWSDFEALRIGWLREWLTFSG